MKLSFFGISALTFLAFGCSSGDRYPAGRVSGGDSGGSVPPTVPPTVPSGTRLTGSIFKHHKTSDMSVNLRLSSSDANGKQVGYTVRGDAITLDPPGENNRINFESVNFNKVGTTSGVVETAVEHDEYGQPINKELKFQPIDNYGILKVNGRGVGTCQALDLVLAGTRIKGSISQQDIGNSTDAISFFRLTVNGRRSEGRMLYRNDSYYAEYGLKYGPFMVTSPNGASSPIMTYVKKDNVMNVNLVFGRLRVNGVIRFSDKTETSFREYAQRVVNDPWLDMRIQQGKMDNAFNSRKSIFETMIDNQVLTAVQQANTRTVHGTIQRTEYVATEGQYDLNITFGSGKPLIINGDASIHNAPVETQLKGLLSYFMMTAYDSFSEDDNVVEKRISNSSSY